MKQYIIAQESMFKEPEPLYSKNFMKRNLLLGDFELHRDPNKHETPTLLNGIQYYNLYDTITGFSKLQPNWDGYNADTISDSAIDTAIVALIFLFSKGLLSNSLKTSIFPMRDGGIQFEFDGRNICSELEINQNSEIKFIIFDKKGTLDKEMKLGEISELSSHLEGVQYV